MKNEGLASQEDLLVDYARRLDRHREGRRAVHAHLSKLKQVNRREHHLRIAMNSIEEIVQAYEGQIFLLGNADMVITTRYASLAQLDEMVMKLKFLFSEDPLTYQDTDMGGHGRFATVYNIETQYNRFMELAENIFREERARAKRLAEMANQSGEVLEDSRSPLSPDQLGKLESFLKQADLTNVLRRQPICAVAEGANPKPIFNELFISIMDLAKTVLPDVNLAANRWLFQHLTQTLDRRVLKMLIRNDDSSLHSSFSLNLNVGTLLTPEFLEFDSSLRMGSRGTLVVEMQMIDIMADFSSFLFARDFVREKGYRICLDGCTPDLLPFIERRKMGLDLIKLNAGPMFDAGAPSDRVSAIAADVERMGKGRIILARCDNKNMVDVGIRMGITMFQGHFLDQMLQSIKNRTNPPTPRFRR